MKKNESSTAVHYEDGLYGDNHMQFALASNQTSWDLSYFGTANLQDYESVEDEDMDEKEIFLEELKEAGVDLSLFEKNNTADLLLDSLDNQEAQQPPVATTSPISISKEEKNITSNDNTSSSGWFINPQSLIFDKNDPDPEHDEFVKVDKEPVPINLEAIFNSIEYPPDAKREGVKGTVYIKLLIDRNGIPKNYYVRYSPDNRLKNAVLDKLKYVRYKPAILNGKPVKNWVQVEYEFK
ncbi:MAG: energy transducer TonB [Bacteroidia bacterium]|nr:energy transducer TonB [Bacteroidia bacterium]